MIPISTSEEERDEGDGNDTRGEGRQARRRGGTDMGRGEKTDERKSKEEEERWKRRGEKLMSEKENKDNKAEEERWTRRTRRGQQGQEGRKTTGRTRFFSEALPFAPPPRMKITSFLAPPPRASQGHERHHRAGHVMSPRRGRRQHSAGDMMSSPRGCFRLFFASVYLDIANSRYRFLRSATSAS